MQTFRASSSERAFAFIACGTRSRASCMSASRVSRRLSFNLESHEVVSSAVEALAKFERDDYERMKGGIVRRRTTIARLPLSGMSSSREVGSR